MTGKLVNLRTARKQKARKARRAETAEGPAPSGAARKAAKADAVLERRRLEAHRRDDGPAEG